MTSNGGKLIVYGASGHGKVVADAAQCAGWSVFGFADDDPKKENADILNWRVVACGYENLVRVCTKEKATVIIGIGNNAARKRAFEKIVESGIELATIVHPKAIRSESVKIGQGTVVFAAAVINPDTKIGENAIINTSSSIDHDNVIGDHTHISPGVSLGGTVSVGEGSHIGIGSSIKNNINVGKWTVCGAGSVIVSNIPDCVIAYGVPAKVIRKIES